MNENIIQNPITSIVLKSINCISNKLYFAVPFITSFAQKVLIDENIIKVKDKKLITRFDETNLSSFDIPTLKYILSCGFEIRFNNQIHLKLYITDDETFISSSNMTKGGFEDNIELTVSISNSNVKQCEDIFDDIWEKSKNNKITDELLNENYEKYKILKKRTDFRKLDTVKLVNTQQVNEELDVQKIIDEILNQNQDYTRIRTLAYEANKLRENTKKQLRKGFDKELFYVPVGHPNRKLNLFYDLFYGAESSLAGTGLRENQMAGVFEHNEFYSIISYIFPEMIGLQSWNLNDEEIFHQFCNGLFDFDIPYYKETIPVRLASYFNPEHLMPIFNLNHLNKMCEAFGLKSNAKTRGDRLFLYNRFIYNAMKQLPHDNYIKSHIGYNILYTVELYNELKRGKSFDDVVGKHKEKWKKDMITFGKQILQRLNVIFDR